MASLIMLGNSTCVASPCFDLQYNTTDISYLSCQFSHGRNNSIKNLVFARLITDENPRASNRSERNTALEFRIISSAKTAVCIRPRVVKNKFTVGMAETHVTVDENSNHDGSKEESTCKKEKTF